MEPLGQISVLLQYHHKVGLFLQSIRVPPESESRRLIRPETPTLQRLVSLPLIPFYLRPASQLRQRRCEVVKLIRSILLQVMPMESPLIHSIMRLMERHFRSLQHLQFERQAILGQFHLAIQRLQKFASLQRMSLVMSEPLTPPPSLLTQHHQRLRPSRFHQPL